MYFHHDLYQEELRVLSDLDIEWDRLERSRILIVGASGMIGTVLVDALMRRNMYKGSGMAVYAMGRSEKNARARFSRYFDRPDFRFITGDVNNGLPLNEKADYIFHCASNTHPRAYAADPVGTIMTNVLGTENVLNYAVKSGCRRVVFLSSVEIYGENKNNLEAFREDECGYLDCNTVRAGYPEGKRVGEALCQAYRSRYDLDVVIPRICRVYGPTMLESDSKALAQFIKNAVNGENIVLKSDGAQYFSYCYAADVVSALLYILLYGKNGEAYNVADQGSDIYLRDLAALLAAQSTGEVVFELPDPLEKKGYSTATRAVLDACKLQQLGWAPFYTIQQGIERTVAILKDKGTVVPDT